MKTALAALLLAFATAAAAAPSFRDLRAGERVRVQVQSRGCFHKHRYEFVLEGGDGLVARSSAGRAATLSSAQRAGLDRLIQFYRKGEEGLCTTQDDVTLTYFRGDAKIATERYTDRTCGTDRVNAVTTFRDIGDQLGVIAR